MDSYLDVVTQAQSSSPNTSPSRDVASVTSSESSPESATSSIFSSDAHSSQSSAPSCSPSNSGDGWEHDAEVGSLAQLALSTSVTTAESSTSLSQDSLNHNQQKTVSKVNRICLAIDAARLPKISSFPRLVFRRCIFTCAPC